VRVGVRLEGAVRVEGVRMKGEEAKGRLRLEGAVRLQGGVRLEVCGWRKE
jgi:hypothetical protein